MKPVITVNAAKAFDTGSAAALDHFITALEADGYHVAFTSFLDEPPISIANPTPDRRERIATQLLAGILANNARIELRNPDYDINQALYMADALITELDKKP